MGVSDMVKRYEAKDVKLFLNGEEIKLPSIDDIKHVAAEIEDYRRAKARVERPEVDLLPGISFSLGFEVKAVEIKNRWNEAFPATEEHFIPGNILCILFKSLDRDTGTPIELTYYEPIPYLRADNKSEIARWLRHTLAKLAQHEIDEGIRVDGERPFDPHKTEKIPYTLLGDEPIPDAKDFRFNAEGRYRLCTYCLGHKCAFCAFKGFR